MPRSPRHPPWSDLPPELLSTIANFLTPNPYNTSLDIVAFRSVCNSWRGSSFPPTSRPSILPISTIPPPSLVHYSPLCFLSTTIVYSLRPKQIDSNFPPSRFVLFVDEFEPERLQIRQPFSRWPYSVPVFFPKTVNLFDYHAREIGRFCNLTYNCNNDNEIGVRFARSGFASYDALKVVLLCDGSAAVALFKRGKLGLLRLDFGINVVSRSNSQWEVLHDGKGFRFDDIVEYKGRVLGVDRGGRVYEIGRSKSEINLIARSTLTARRSGGRKRLVESLGSLYLVVRCKVGGPKDVNVFFKVFQLNVERKKWVEVSSIGDCVFFFGHDFSFSASAEDVSCPKNCISYRKYSFKHSHSNKIDGREVFCSLGSDGVEIGVYLLGAAAHVGASELHSGYLQTLWPPPVWIWPVDRLARLEKVGAAVDYIHTYLVEKIKIKYPKLPVDGTIPSCINFEQLGIPVSARFNRFKGVIFLRTLQRLKRMLASIRLAEQKGMKREKILLDALRINKQVGRSFILAQTAKTKERHSCLDDTAQSTIDPSFIRNELSALIVKQNSMIFKAEESACHLVRYYEFSGIGEESHIVQIMSQIQCFD
ncbi:hypothetical protein vseg_015850 [Gypsophila vaccaria]